MSTSRTSQPWSAAERRARRQLEANRVAIESSPRGIPAGGISHATEASRSKGYTLITAEWSSRCLACRDKLRKGQQVRYWHGQGATCQSCTLGGP